MYIYVLHAAVSLDFVNFRSETNEVRHLLVFTRMEPFVLFLSDVVANLTGW